jgi:hypothetical protein
MCLDWKNFNRFVPFIIVLSYGCTDDFISVILVIFGLSRQLYLGKPSKLICGII